MRVRTGLEASMSETDVSRAKLRPPVNDVEDEDTVDERAKLSREETSIFILVG